MQSLLMVSQAVWQTTGNALSFWGFRAGVDNAAEETVLAVYAAVKKKSSLQAIDVVSIPLREIESHGIPLEREPGDTAVLDLRDHHVNAVDLDLERLAALARCIHNGVRGDGLRRLTKSQVKAVLVEAVRSKRLDIRDLDDNVRKHIGDGVPR